MAEAVGYQVVYAGSMPARWVAVASVGSITVVGWFSAENWFAESFATDYLGMDYHSCR